MLNRELEESMNLPSFYHDFHLFQIGGIPRTEKDKCVSLIQRRGCPLVSVVLLSVISLVCVLAAGGCVGGGAACLAASLSPHGMDRIDLATRFPPAFVLAVT